MNFKQFFIVSFVLFLILSCSNKTWTVTQSTSTKIPIDKSCDSIADSAYIQHLMPVKQKVDQQMNRVIGQASETMRGYAPESLLSNFSADVYRQAASELTGDNVDIAIVNMGSLRTAIPQGEIPIRKVFELMPFENELVVLWLRGDKLFELLQYFAGKGGEGVSGLRMKIIDGKAEDVFIGNTPLDLNKLYSIATNDYLADGNDNMNQLAKNEKRINTGLKIRNMLLDYIVNETKKGKQIQSVLDGRISFSK